MPNSPRRRSSEGKRWATPKRRPRALLAPSHRPKMRSVDSGYDSFAISAGLHGECTELSWPVQEPLEHKRWVGTSTDTQSDGVPCEKVKRKSNPAESFEHRRQGASTVRAATRVRAL